MESIISNSYIQKLQGIVGSCVWIGTNERDVTLFKVVLGTGNKVQLEVEDKYYPMRVYCSKKDMDIIDRIMFSYDMSIISINDKGDVQEVVFDKREGIEDFEAQFIKVEMGANEIVTDVFITGKNIKGKIYNSSALKDMCNAREEMFRQLNHTVVERFRRIAEGKAFFTCNYSEYTQDIYREDRYIQLFNDVLSREVGLLDKENIRGKSEVTLEVKEEYVEKVMGAGSLLTDTLKQLGVTGFNIVTLN